jgi:hypothetical protein
MSLFDMSRRTRYDFDQLGPHAYPLLVAQWKDIAQHCVALNKTRPPTPTQPP